MKQSSASVETSGTSCPGVLEFNHDRLSAVDPELLPRDFPSPGNLTQSKSIYVGMVETSMLGVDRYIEAGGSM